MIKYPLAIPQTDKLSLTQRHNAVTLYSDIIREYSDMIQSPMIMSVKCDVMKCELLGWHSKLVL